MYDWLRMSARHWSDGLAAHEDVKIQPDHLTKDTFPQIALKYQSVKGYILVWKNERKL